MTETADSATEAPARGRTNRPNLLPTAVLLAGAILAYGAVAAMALFNGQVSAEEVSYLIRSWWYTGGGLAPYTATDATAQMPFYFYLLGPWQGLFGLGLLPARLLSLGIGLISGALVFAICRRLTANPLIAAAAVFIFFATPSTVVFFATATPAAAVSALHLAAIWWIVARLGRPRLWATVLMGLLCTALYFFRQNMLLSVVVLVPLYIAGIGRKRWLHTGVLLATLVLATAATLFSFPGKLGEYALRLPVISPWLDSLGLLAPNFTLIDKGTIGSVVMGPAFERLAPLDILDAVLLPHMGTVLLALMLLGLAGGALRVLWIAPLYFLWLIAGHYLGTLGACANCMVTYTPYFSAVGALAAALTLAMLAHRARRAEAPAAPIVLVGALLAAALNTFAPNLATQSAYRSFPVPLMTQGRSATEMAEIETMARWIAGNTAEREPILLLHSLGSQRVASLPYAVFLSGRTMPAQSLNPAASRRTVNPKLSGPAREAVQAAIEEESLWSEETFSRWVERDYDVILWQHDPTLDQKAQVAAITARFDLAGTTGYRGAMISLYKRKPVQ